MSSYVIQSSVGKYVVPTKNAHTTTIAKEAKVVSMFPQGVNVGQSEAVQLRVAA